MQLLSGVLGSGVLLGLPFCFRSCGALLGSLLLALCAGASLLSAQLLLAAAAATGARSYEGLATAALGARAGALVAACVWALQLGSVVASVNIMADLLSAFAGSVVPPGAEPSRQGIIAAVVALALLPLALAVRSPRSAAALSGTAAAFVAALMVAVVTHAAGGALAARSHAHARAPLALWRAEGAPVALPVLVFALSGHALLFPVYASLKAPTPRRMAAVSARALGGAAAVYAVMGLGGYAAFRERTSGDVLRNFGGSQGSGAAQAAWRALKLAYGLSVAAAVPLALLPLREALTAGSAAAAAAGPGSPAARRSRAVLRHTAGVAALLAAVLACALAVPNLEFVFALTGATACVLLSYILPAAIYLGVASGRGVPAGSGGGVAVQPGCATLLCGDTGGGAGSAAVWLPAPRRTAAAARCLLLAGILAAAVCTRATLSAVAEEADTVQLARALVKTERVAAQKTQKIAAAAAVVAQLDGLQDAAAALSAARVEAAEALTHMRSVVADTFTSSSSSDAKPAATAAHAGGAALEGAAAALAAAHSKVDARLAGVVSAAQALNDVADGAAAGAAAAAAAAAAVVLPASPPPMPPPPPVRHATAEEQSASHAALEAALAISMRAGAPEVRPLHFQEREEPPPPPPRPPPSPPPPPGGALAGAAVDAGVRARANATVAALAETAVALDAVQRAANRAAGAAARGGSGGGAGKRAADVDNAVADAGAALSAADASLSALQAAAGSQAAEAERALVGVLLDAAAPEATAAALAVLRRDAEAAAKPAADGTQLPLPLPLPTLHLRHRPPPPPPPRLNATAAAAAAVQAVARTTARQAGITVRLVLFLRDVRACGLTMRLLGAGSGARGGGGDASGGDCAPAGGGRCAGGGGGGCHCAAARCRRARGAAGAGRCERARGAKTRQRPQCGRGGRGGSAAAACVMHQRCFSARGAAGRADSCVCSR